MKNYYTYAYLREDGTPYYIGKGINRRVYSNWGRKISPPKDKSRILFLKQNLTEEEAFKHEKYMIAIYGRIDLGTGILQNRTDGGEGQSGLIHSEETRKKLSEFNMGKHLSEETKRKISESHKGENNPNFGKTHSEESKRKISESSRGRRHSEESKRKLSLALSGENHPNYGKKHSEETKRKISESKKKKNILL